MAQSTEICGSDGHAAACGSRLCPAGIIACVAGFAGCGNRSFAFYTLRVWLWLTIRLFYWKYAAGLTNLFHWLGICCIIESVIKEEQS